MDYQALGYASEIISETDSGTVDAAPEGQD